MPRTNPKVDAYIAEAAPFAKPILRRLRKIVHAGCPSVEETIKWGFPHFVYKGNIAGMAAFKQHCVFGFWKDALLFDREQNGPKEGMGQFGRLTHVSELPNETILIAYVRKAAELNDAGIKLARPAKKQTEVLEPPADSPRRCRKPRRRGRHLKSSAQASAESTSTG